MPLKNGALTPGERAVAAAMAATGSQGYAHYQTGLTQTHISRMLKRPAVKAEVIRQQQEILTTKGLPAAVNCLIEIAESPKFPANARVSASKVIIDNSGMKNEGGIDKEPHEMTPEEINKAIQEGNAKLQRLANAAADQARLVINQEPSSIDDEDMPEPSIFE